MGACGSSGGVSTRVRGWRAAVGAGGVTFAATMSGGIESIRALERVADLLRAAKGLPVVAPRRATYLELTGQSHREEVASRLLEFFLNPEGEHGLGRLFLDALLGDPELEGLAVESVEREVTTRLGNRLDLLVEAGSHVVGIENKVLAALNNPWRDYWRHVQDVAGAGRAPLLVLLLVYEPRPGQVPEFVRVVTYRELMTRVRERLGRYASGAPAQYVSFALDFAETMENHYVGSTMNPKLLELIREYPDEALTVAECIKEFHRVVADKGAQLEAAVLALLGDEPPPNLEVKRFAGRSSLRHCQVFEVRLPPDAWVPVDVYLTPRFLEVSVHDRSEPYGGAGPRQTWLSALPWPVGPDAGGRTVEGYERIVTARYPFDAPLEVVAEHVLGVLAVIRSQQAVP